MKKKLLFLKNNPQEILHREKVNERLRFAAAHDVNTVLKYLGTTGKGLPSGMVEQARERYGDNVVTHGQKESLFTRICKAFINPFTAILFVLAAVSAFTDIWLADICIGPDRLSLHRDFVCFGGSIGFYRYLAG